MRSTFWFVWNTNGRAPAFKHETAESAKTEAQRLARAHRGEEFIILQAVGGAVLKDPVEEIKFDDIPF